MGVSERVTVLDHGEKIAEGVRRRSRADPRVIEAYLGKQGGAADVALLEVQDIHAYYGAIEALKGVSLTVDEGEIVTLIGSNGAGKSTTLRSISGLTRARAGSDHLRRRRTSRACRRTRSSRSGSPCRPRAAHCFRAHDGARRTSTSAPTSGADPTSPRTSSACSRCSRGCSERERQKAGTMSGGEQQMLAIGRALMARPQLLLLDEPSMGIAPDPGPADLRDDRRDQPRRRDDPARRAERQLRARRTPGAATCSRPAASCCPTTPRAARRPRGPAGVPGGMTVLAAHRRHGAVPAVHLAAVRRGRGVAGRAQGLRRAPRVDVRPAAERRRGSLSCCSSRAGPDRPGRSTGRCRGAAVADPR